MMATDDDHGPQAGCNYESCGFRDPAIVALCPFTKEGGSDPDILPTHKCVHEWRQVSNVLDLRFYCIHCLTITTSEVQHDIVISPNRGEKWMD